VAIFNDKTPYGYASMLACLKLGLIYANLDITSPWSRLEKILSNSSPSVVCMDIEDERLSGKVSELLRDTHVVHLTKEAFRADLAKLPDYNLEA
ncbi:AMP-binding protein, partial [Streptomyces galilaeus]|uniref:AMP-binding protein n=1 Tax=Streptomyces galilaeus TaxID=33899 RepID=UPI0038F66181